jgi:hypothetical protein
VILGLLLLAAKSKGEDVTMDDDWWKLGGHLSSTVPSAPMIFFGDLKEPSAATTCSTCHSHTSHDIGRAALHLIPAQGNRSFVVLLLPFAQHLHKTTQGHSDAALLLLLIATLLMPLRPLMCCCCFFGRRASLAARATARSSAMHLLLEVFGLFLCELRTDRR